MSYAEKSVGLTDGTDAGREAVKWYAEQILRLDEQLAEIESALHAACATGKQVFVIGGASIYAAAWPYCRYFYLTRIEADFAGDTLLPAAIPLADWGLVQERQARYLERISGQSVNCRFQVYEQGNPRVLPGRVYG